MTSRNTILTLFLVGAMVLSLGSTGVVGVNFGAVDGDAPSLDADRADQAVEIDSALEDSETDEVQVLVRLEQYDRLGDGFGELSASDLRTHAERVQSPLVEHTERTSGIELENTFWIANAALVTVDTAEHSLDRLAAVDGVTRLEANTIYDHPNPVETATGASDDAAYTYGLEQINVPSVWEDHGVTGENVRVAALDTGVDADHDDIDLADDGWAAFDEDGDETGEEPVDIQGHGTHVSGTIAGGNASGTHIGVAPDVDLMHGKVFFDDGGQTVGSTASILAGMEWAVEEDADVMSMSLGSAVEDESIFDDTYVEPVENAREAGTVVVASSGNNGPELTGSPGNLYSSFAIAANDEDREIASFSSGERITTAEAWNVSDDASDRMEYWPDQYLVPDVSGPGVDVVSALPDGEYGANSGTSMSAPHVAGQLALLLDANPDLDIDQLEGTVRGTADHPDGPDAEPGIAFGQGIVDAERAVETVADDSTITGQVTDSDGNPAERVTVDVEGGSSDVTDATGEYVVMVESGEATITVDGFGLEPIEVALEVDEGETVEEDLVLEDEFAVDVLEEPVSAIGIGDDVTAELDVAHLESYTLDLADESTVSADGLTASLDGEEIEFGEAETFDEPVTEPISVVVESEQGADEGDLILEHDLEGLDDQETVTTGPTELIEDPDEPIFEIQSYDAPSVLEEDGVLAVEATVENTGDLPSEESVTHWIVDPLIGSFAEPTELEPGESEVVEWQVSLEGLGTGVFPHGVFSETDDGVEETIEIADYDGIAVYDLDTPDVADEGEEIEINATTERVGGDYVYGEDVEFLFDGEPVENASVTLEEGETEEVSFTHELPDDSGVHDIAVQTSDSDASAPIVVGEAIVEDVAVVDESETGADASRSDRFDADEATVPGGTAAVSTADAAERTDLEPRGADDLVSVLEAELPVNYNVDHVGTDELLEQRSEYDRFVVDDFGGDELVTEFIDETRDANQAVVMLDQWGDQSNAIANASSALGNPEATDDADSIDGARPAVSYNVLPQHEDDRLFDGIQDLDEGIVLHNAAYADMAWFENYDGETLASVSSAGDGGGEAVGIDEDNGEILLASLGFGGSMGSHYYTPDAIQVLTNAVTYEWDDEEPAHFDVSIDADDAVDVGEVVDVEATITNDGDETATQEIVLSVDGIDRETTTVEDLEGGASESVAFEYETDETDEGEISVAVASEDDQAAVDVTVGDEPDREYPVLLGDVLDDGDVGLGDVLAIQELSLDSDTDESLEEERADLNRDGDVSLADVMLAQEKSLGNLEGSQLDVDGLEGPDEIGDDDVVEVSVDVTNTGDLGALDEAELRVADAGDDLADGTTVDATVLDMGVDGSDSITLELDASVVGKGTYEYGVVTADSSVSSTVTIDATA